VCSAHRIRRSNRRVCCAHRKISLRGAQQACPERSRRTAISPLCHSCGGRNPFPPYPIRYPLPAKNCHRAHRDKRESRPVSVGWASAHQECHPERTPRSPCHPESRLVGKGSISQCHCDHLIFVRALRGKATKILLAESHKQREGGL
jgi:hypothetical protein